MLVSNPRYRIPIPARFSKPCRSVFRILKYENKKTKRIGINLELRIFKMESY
jgi:hypothetical protein